jgi:hypothetical protein
MFWIRIGGEKQAVRYRVNVDFVERGLYALAGYLFLSYCRSLGHIVTSIKGSCPPEDIAKAGS